MAIPYWRVSVVLALLGFAVDVSALGPFTEVGAERGILPYVQAQPMGSGVAAADIDNDFDVDWFVPTIEGLPDQLYINQGNGFVIESAAQRGLTELTRSRSALWFDIDGDRDLDLVVGGDCFGEWAPTPNEIACEPGRVMQRLYRQNADGGFTNITTGSGLEQDSGSFSNDEHRGGYAAADIDADGDLDLYSAVWYGKSRLFRNEGNGTFADATDESGVATLVELAQWQPVFVDVNGDALVDLFVAVDFAPNLLFVNDGMGHFNEQAASAGVATSWNEMGVAVGDYDNDGDPDIYATNVWQRSAGEHNVLFRNDTASSAPLFTNVAEALGVGNTSWGWGATFFDADLDGDLDLGVTNGFSDVEGGQYLTDASCLFQNNGESFTEVGASAGFSDTYWGSALVALDFDQDGRIDLLQTTKIHPTPGPLRLLRNESVTHGNFVRVIPRMLSGNTQAIGAKITARSGALTWTRFITAGISFLGQEPAEAHFGLGELSRLDEIVVKWPNGQETRRTEIAANGVVLIQEDEILVSSFE